MESKTLGFIGLGLAGVASYYALESYRATRFANELRVQHALPAAQEANPQGVEHMAAVNAQTLYEHNIRELEQRAFASAVLLAGSAWFLTR